MVCVVDEDGCVIFEGWVRLDSGVLVVILVKKVLLVERVGFEIGVMLSWFWYELKWIGLLVVCIDVWYVYVVLFVWMNKSDENDV